MRLKMDHLKIRNRIKYETKLRMKALRRQLTQSKKWLEAQAFDTDRSYKHR
jgi:hypothetical protein